MPTSDTHPAPQRAKPSQQRKRTIYFPLGMMEQIEAEARRQLCSVSRILRIAWVRALPLMKDFADLPDNGACTSSTAEMGEMRHIPGLRAQQKAARGASYKNEAEKSSSCP